MLPLLWLSLSSLNSALVVLKQGGFEILIGEECVITLGPVLSCDLCEPYRAML